MKVCECPEFHCQFPETFNWQCLDSPKLSRLADELATQIESELEQPAGNRINVSGLRFALRRIAEIADL